MNPKTVNEFMSTHRENVNQLITPNNFSNSLTIDIIMIENNNTQSKHRVIMH